MADERVHRQLAAIFAADVAGYSRLMSGDEVGTLKALTDRRIIMDRLIATHAGRIANTAGDSVLAEFPSVVDAVQCAIAAQKALAGSNAGLPADQRLDFRIGIHVGDVMRKDRDILGDGVNIAARLQDLAKPGGICLSASAHEHVRRIVPATFVDQGLQTLKNIRDPVRVFAIAIEAMGGRSPQAATHLALPGKPSIAVLAFANLSGDPGQEYFADGMADEILTALSRFHELFVIARTSSFNYKGKPADVRQIGRELGVRYVLEGSVRKSGDRVRITGRLVDTTSGVHIWTDRFEGSLDDIFELQDRVAAAVVSAVAPKLEQAEIARVRAKPTESLDAYDLFMQAVASIYRWGRSDLEEAERLLAQSMELDPGFANARAGAAVCITFRMVNLWSEDLARDAISCGTLARQAVDLGKDDPTVLAWAGYSLSLVVGALDEGIALIERAISLNPNLAAAWSMGAVVQILLGHPETAIEYSARAMRLSPRDTVFHLMMHTTARACFYAGRYDEAIDWSIRAMRESPHGQDQSLGHLIASYALTQRQTEAEAALVMHQRIHPQARISNLWQAARLRRPDDVARLKEGLRLAGMPE